MRNRFWLLIAIAEAWLVFIGGASAIVVAMSEISFTDGEKTILGSTAAFLAIGIAAWWMLRALRPYRTKHEARAVAGAFIFSTPLSIVIGTEFSAGLGGYCTEILGFFGGLVAGVASLLVISTLISLAFCLPALWIVQYEAKLESTYYPDTTLPS